MTDETSPLRAAASIIVVRHQPASAPHFLMIERAQGMRFAGGAMVFPGGAVDPADVEHAQLLSPEGDVDDMAARIAAVREAIEEAGLVLGWDGGPPDAARSLALREALRSGVGLAQAAQALDLAFDFSSLIPFARWCPPTRVLHKRYDTRFFLAVVEEVPDWLTPDGGETARLVWHSARDVLDEADAGRAKIIFPTRRNLERLAQYGSVAALLDHAHSTPVSLISPWIETRDDMEHLCIPEGLGYPVTSEPLSSAHRG